MRRFRFVSNFASIQINKLREFDVFPEFHAWRNGEEIRHRVTASPAILHRTIGRFQNADNSQACNAVIEWLGVFFDTFQKVSSLGTQGLDLFYLWGIHVAGTVGSPAIGAVCWDSWSCSHPCHKS